MFYLTFQFHQYRTLFTAPARSIAVVIPQDDRHVLGEIVNTRATYVTNGRKSREIFGSESEEKLLVGRVVGRKKKNIKQGNERRHTVLVVFWQIGIEKKTTEILLKQNKLGSSLLQNGKIRQRKCEPDYSFIESQVQTSPNTQGSRIKVTSKNGI